MIVAEKVNRLQMVFFFFLLKLLSEAWKWNVIGSNMKEPIKPTNSIGTLWSKMEMMLMYCQQCGSVTISRLMDFRGEKMGPCLSMDLPSCKNAVWYISSNISTCLRFCTICLPLPCLCHLVLPVHRSSRIQTQQFCPARHHVSCLPVAQRDACLENATPPTFPSRSVFLPRGHLKISGDIFVCHNWWHLLISSR